MTLRGRAKVEAVRLHGQFKLSTPSSNVILLCDNGPVRLKHVSYKTSCMIVLETITRSKVITLYT